MMKKTLLITESQKKLILSESINEEFIDIVKNNYNFIKKVIKMSSEQINLNLEFLLTWGASIGGFMGPLNDYIAGKFPELSDVELSLILTGIIAMYYIDNKKMVQKILNSIKENGLSTQFKVLSRKSKELKDVFTEFMSSLNVTLHKVTNIMSYAFIIPIIPMIYESVSRGVLNQSDGKEIALRVGAFGILTVSGIVLRELITKLIKRFSKK